ncbi:YibE/F family protein [Phytoactinopolyspora mesophila]|uniref:YibE/F family protein n=1 Tax=Phytoactinopolyspora mesophila TaxID=2650750 RepID=A0A7K3M1L0_9ACTN|nr:YibE/F family protein [Phytoactinopolyspora mesophila]
MTGSHSHMHPDTPPAGPRVRKAVLSVLLPLIVVTIVGLIVLWPTDDPPRIDSGVRTDAVITDIRPCEDVQDAPPPGGHSHGGQPSGECREGVVEITSGPDKGEETVVSLWFGEGAPAFDVGDKVVLAGAFEQPLDQRYEVTDFQRGMPLLWLAILFAVAVVVLSRWRGLAALGGLVISVVVLITFLLPALLAGKEPLAVAVVGASVIMIVTLYMSHGISIRTSVALIGTLISLTLTGLLGALFTALGQFTGLVDHAAAYIGTVNAEFNIRGLLLAGLVVGALGVLDDTTVTQTATIWELSMADPNSSRTELFAAGMRIGREHVAATVNTLVLAYVGASLPLLMLFSVAGQGVIDAVTTEAVAQEVVRALVGGLGIIAAVPVTTGLAVLAVRQGQPEPAGKRRQRSGRGGARAASKTR